MGIIDEKEDMHEAAHDFYREEESRLEAEQEAKEIEMLTLAEEWAYDAPWLPTSIRPAKDGTYLTLKKCTLQEAYGETAIMVNFWRKGKWLCDGIWKVTAWLPMPEANE